MVTFMKMMNPSHQNALGKVRKIIRKIEDKSASVDYIFRGEPAYYPRVSSTLYNQHLRSVGSYFDAEAIQDKLLETVREHLPGIAADSDFEILTELHFHGGATNLIEFTSDSRVALFFACDGSHDEDGRIILRRRDDLEELIDIPREPSKPLNRVMAQKSVFVQPRQGFVEFDPEDVVTMPASIKIPMLDYLRKFHNISAKTIYNDLHGFIRIQGIYHTAFEELCSGLRCQNNANYEKSIAHYTEALKLKPDYVEAYNNRGNVYASIGEEDKAISDFSTAINLKPDAAEVYNNRGTIYVGIGRYDQAVSDFARAVELKPNLALASYNRGVAYLKKGDFDTAIADYTTAIELNPNYADAYNNRGVTYHRKGDFDTAIKDFNTAIELNPDDAETYCNRGEAWMHLHEWDKAKADLTVARDKGVDIIASFHNDYESVADFEQQNGVQVPPALAEMLTRE